MGYAVYEDRIARDWGIMRWAGYGVPAECDMPECHAEIDRGMGFQCEDEEREFMGEHRGGDCMGCGLYFCSEHQLGNHEGILPKPDSKKWIEHMLTDESWEQWRVENPRQVEEMKNG